MTLSRFEEQQERLDVLRNDQRVRNQGSTFSQFAESEANEAKGRFSAISSPRMERNSSSHAPKYDTGYITRVVM